jgi:hypothetical protein
LGMLKEFKSGNLFYKNKRWKIEYFPKKWFFFFRKPVSVIGNIFIYKKIYGKSKQNFYINGVKPPFGWSG